MVVTGFALTEEKDDEYYDDYSGDYDDGSGDHSDEKPAENKDFRDNMRKKLGMISNHFFAIVNM